MIFDYNPITGLQYRTDENPSILIYDHATVPPDFDAKKFIEEFRKMPFILIDSTPKVESMEEYCFPTITTNHTTSFVWDREKRGKNED